MDHQQKNDRTDRERGLGKKKQEEKGIRMAVLRFQTSKASLRAIHHCGLMDEAANRIHTDSRRERHPSIQSNYWQNDQLVIM